MFNKKKDPETGSDAAVAVAEGAEDTVAEQASAEEPELEADIFGDAPETPETPETGETAAGDATGEETAAENAAEDDPAPDGEEEEEEEEDDGISLDLMDIFESEQAESTSTAGVYSEFLDSLTMEDVLEQAEGLLDEMRTMLKG